jgi:Uma2 family endonuclease
MKEAEIAPIAELYPPQGEWTETYYFALPDTNRYVELSEGRLIMPPHPTDSHQFALQSLFLKLHEFVRSHRLGTVRIAPLPVRLWTGKIREPDILFVSREQSDRIDEKVYGVPDLVVEVVSSGTEQIDRGEKLFEYAKAGVEEYWLVDPQKRKIEVYSLKHGAYELNETYRPAGEACSKLLHGFKVKVDEIF